MKPTENWRYAAEMDEEAGIRHLVQGRECANEGSNSAVFKYDGQQEVLRAGRDNHQLRPRDAREREDLPKASSRGCIGQ